MKNVHPRIPWNKGKLIGQKSPLKLREIWAIRNYLELGRRLRDLALFNLGIDSKLRGCDLTSLRVRDIAHGNVVLSRAMVMQKKTQRPVQFELMEQTRNSVGTWIIKAGLKPDDYLFSQSPRESASPLNSAIRANIAQLGKGDRS